MSSAQLSRRVVKALLLLALFALTLPALTGLIDLNVDSEWQMGLQTAVHQNVHWGPQLLWTFGPLGYLQYPLLLYPREWMIAVAAILALSVAFVVAIGVFLHAHRSHLGWWVVVVGILVVTRGVSSGFELKLAVCILVFSALAADDKVPARAATLCAVLAGLAFALGGMVRGTELLVAEVGTPAVVLALALGRRRRQAAALAASFVVGFLVVWTAAGQWVGDIPIYLRGSWEISSGYSWLGGERSVRAEAALSLVAVAPVVAVACLTAWRRCLAVGVAAIPAVLYGLVTYKEGIVGDGATHRLHFAVTLMVVLTLLATAAVSRLGRVAPLVAIVGVAFAWLFIAPSVRLTGYDWNTAPPGDGSPGAVLTAYRHYAHLVINSSARVAEIAASQAHFRSEAALLPATVASMRSGRTLFDPIDVGNAWAYDIAWAPGPVMQNYSAYTPWLEALDATTLESPNRPAHVLLTADRFIFEEWSQFQDPAAFRALLGNYHLNAWTLAQARPGVLVFDAGGSTLPAPTCTQRLPMLKFGDAVRLSPTPVSSYLFVDIRPSLVGSARALLVRSAKLLVQLQVDGTWTQAHYVAVASPANGLFVGGLVTNNQEMYELLTGRSRTTITAIRVSTAYPGDFASPIAVSLRSPC